jgi:hypothetical protein
VIDTTPEEEEELQDIRKTGVTQHDAPRTTTRSSVATPFKASINQEKQEDDRQQQDTQPISPYRTVLQ